MDFLPLSGWMAIATAALLWWYLRVPSTIPRDIPQIPIYAYICAIWWNMGHMEVYNRWVREPMEKHGAVAMWFTGKWCVLVAHPEYLTDLLRDGDTYPKIGINRRAPGGVLGIFSGDNIINTSNHSWGVFTSIMKPGIQKRFELEPIHEKAKRLAQRMIQAQEVTGPEHGIQAMPWMGRFGQDVASLCFFDFDLQALDEPRVPYEPVLFEIIMALFNRWYLYFPDLEKLGRFLPSRRRAFSKIQEYTDILDSIVDHTTTRNSEKQSNVVSHSLREALDSGRISYEQYCANLRITFTVGHDNVEFLLTSAMYELGRNTRMQERLRAEVLASPSLATNPDALNNLPYLTSIIYEVLRLYPPIAEMINHTPAHTAFLGGKIPVHPGTLIGWNSYGLHTNPHIWGSDAIEFRPERWGIEVKDIQANVRRQNVKGNYIPFGMHARKCLGQALALTETKLALFEMVRQTKWTVDPNYQLKISGPIITIPLGLKVIVKELDGATKA
ncbi:hypothetical protein ASPWEDRAFT_62293 [Aspergillus wentii DTO 134E9]|uniref:Cytochrome P450 n=1 Tax=Aspergillus wentii DTO 134E9 TaxID=1073089 RepID=A0A1L9R7U4_ASPWE|nr:uncharacterized protein ASPWEDRAFT_62293 [Aspergillus wentii DTO 134E9]KAI9927568.1 hypothetical protein MW887_003186 [Aspergillus wentii]OJJ30943.1 hypothetical protein ASPWEDRAFT_62293 [Aspergillus wentii DTO 134E9]